MSENPRLFGFVRFYKVINKLSDLTSDRNCRFVLWAGNKRLIKRRLFDHFIEQEYSI
ncbi:MAG: hypothetical protein HFH75_12135 [Lachnospiraceae bacterium]|nr:hypothetical protein [Lachnospiraceae bacterium]